MASGSPAKSPARRAHIKDPGLDPVIAMARLRLAKEREVDAQKLSVSALSGGVMHKHLELAALEKEIKALEEGVQEYQDQVDLFEEKKHDIEKKIAPDRTWCETFDQMIGPFEQKYEDCKAEVKVSFDYAKTKYAESLQKLIDDFGFNPAFKRWFDEF